MEIPEIGVTPLDSDFSPVGWDVVSRSTGQTFECSPLSCNLMAMDFPTNRFCLFAEFGSARELALSADNRGCEPGPYHVVEVWRRPVRGNASGAASTHL